jgi:predicted dithiol-disulfide oxidoreductase (DUF899 family)
MNPQRIVSRTEWLVARKELLKKEKESTRQRDALAAARRALPLVEIQKEYLFEGPSGRVSLRDLFQGRSQLIVNHFMFDPGWEEGCKSCSHFADNYAGILVHLAARDTSFAAISRAPLSKIEAFKARMGWSFPWFSSYANDFNLDFAVTIDIEEVEGRGEYNYERAATLFKAGKIWFPKGELPGLSVFLRHGNRVFHSYSTYQRGLDIFLNTYNFLDVTPLGRQEEDGRIQAWIRHHDRYDGINSSRTESDMTLQALLDTYYAGLARRKGWDETIADDFVFTGANPGNGSRGKAAYSEVLHRFSRMFETVRVKQLIIQGDMASAVVTYGAVSPSGKKATFDISEVWTARNGKLASLTIYFDTASWTAFMAD